MTYGIGYWVYTEIDIGISIFYGNKVTVFCIIIIFPNLCIIIVMLFALQII